MIGLNRFDSKRKFETFQPETKDTVERVGYVPLKEQIRLYKEAGVLLKETRALQYDYEDANGRSLTDFEKIETATRDCKDFADMSALIARSEAQARAVELNRQRQADYDAYIKAAADALKEGSSTAGTSQLDKKEDK